MKTEEAIALAALMSLQWLAPAPLHAWEWKGKCGITASTIARCTFIKGDGALGGETGKSYTYILPSGDRFQRFVADSISGAICDSPGLMRKNDGPWFRITTSCQGPLIIHSLPTGNSMLVEICDTP
jgi:hypothetical protein